MHESDEMAQKENKMEIKKIGFWSAICTTTFGLTYIFALILSLIGLIQRPWDTFWQVLPSLFLAWSYMAMMASYYKVSADCKNIYSFVGFSISIIYATINSIVYFTVLTVVIPAILSGQQDQYSVLLFEPGKFLFAINGLAYALMSIAALIASFTFESKGKEAKVKWTMIAHGLLGPFIVGVVLWAPLTYVGALWIITFPALGIASIRFFSQGE
jgi:hypothetical protein